MEHRLRTLTRYVLPALGLSLAATTLQANVGERDRERTGDRVRAEAARDAERDLIDRDMRVSRLLGKNVVNRDGDDIGEIQDLVIDTRDGKIAYAVVSAGGFLGIGDRLVEVPVAKVRGGMRDDKIVMDMTKAELESFRSFDRGKWPDWNRAELREPTQPTGADARITKSDRKRYLRASQVLDARLRDRDGSGVGNVEDIVVNLGSGKVRYGVAEFDPSWFEAGKLVVVPVSQVRAEDGDSDDLVITMERGALRKAPAFDRNTWPDLNDEGFRRDLDTYVMR